MNLPNTDALQWPFFTDQHRQLAHDLDAWAQRELPPFADAHPTAHADVDRVCRSIVDMLAAGGWLSYAVPAPHSNAGAQLDVRSLCIIRETLARHLALADFAFAMQGLGSGAIGLFASEELRQRYLPRVAAGNAIAAFALSEPQAGSDVAAMATTATADGDHYLLQGQKTWISNGGIADFYVVFARTEEDSTSSRTISAFVVDADSDGLEIAERIDVIAPHPLATLRFRDCRVPASQRIGPVGAGFKIALSTLDVFRPTVGAAALGMARRAHTEALAHASTRPMYGTTLADQPLAQAMLADMATDIDASALLVYRAAWEKDRGKPRITREASMAKMYATEAAQRVIDNAVQLLGARGVQSGHPVEELYREIRALRIYEGATQVHQLIIARQELANI